MIKLKEEFDYESLCRKLENQVDLLTAEAERQKKLRENDKNDLENRLKQCQESYAEAEKIHVTRSEVVFSPAGNLLDDSQKHYTSCMHMMISEILLIFYV